MTVNRRNLYIAGLVSCVLLICAAAFYSFLPAKNADAVGGKFAAEPANVDVMLMSSLPLVFGEGADISDMLKSDGPPHPFYEMLQSGYNITPVDSLALPGSSLKTGGPDILILAQPRPLTPEELVTLDDWVRGGGHVLIFADPLLMWHSEYPLGDKRRPQAVSLLTPIFTRWGLDFVFDYNPVLRVTEFDADNVAPGTERVVTITAGTFMPVAGHNPANGVCNISMPPVMARCQIGKGQAIVVADADMLDTEFFANESNRLFVGNLISELAPR